MISKSLQNDSQLNSSSTKRIQSIDLLRGLVMILMTLDHTRYFFLNINFNPLDIEQSNFPLFMTRWITHLCATSFIFLAGVGIYLYFKRIKNKKRLSYFLVMRGIWLIVLELTIINFAWLFNPTFMAAGVIWVIGWSMIFLALIVQLPMRLIALLGINLIVGHNLLDNIPAESLGNLNFLWSFLQQRQLFELSGNIKLYIIYPLIPWVGVMAVGYVFGQVFTWEKERRLKVLKKSSFTLLMGFLVLRGLNFYGDPNPWSQKSTVLKTFFSFMDLYKYPPSLLYLLITLAIALGSLYLFERYSLPIFYPLKILGRVPLFFYILHLWVIHIAAILFAFPKYGYQAITLPYLISDLRPENYGYDLHHVYVIWILILLLLYPMCSWFNNYKSKYKFWWLKFL